jgi:urease accessory protein
MTQSLPWLVLQLADSAFPVGGFAHSAGLEAALQLGEIERTPEALAWICSELIQQTSQASLPFINSAHTHPENLVELDRRFDAFMSNHVANRASRVQGRAFLSTCCRSFELPELETLRGVVRDSRGSAHFAPLFGAICKSLRIGLEDTRQLFLFVTVRGALSAAVRLNAVGPYAAQQLQIALIPLMDRVLDETAHLDASAAAQTSPLLDLFQMSHDQLYSRLFQS